MNKNNNDDIEATSDKKKFRDIMPNLPKNLTLDEKKYLLAIERGDMPNVRRILQRAQRKKDLDINCVDSLGRGALTIAIDQENLEMIELLIILGVETKDALLHAINAEFVEAVELLLEHEELIHKEGEPYSWQTVDINMASFTPDITPLVLAAHRNNYEILKILLDRGATVPMPHDIKCGCDECIKESEEDSLRHSLSRLNEYRALASPSLIALSSSDPILTAFQLSWDLRNLAFAEPECKSEYMELRRQCQQFAVDLLHQSRSSQELAIILNHDPESPPYEEGEHMKLARLELAIQYKQKKFVAHPNIQQLLAAIWYEGVPGFRRKSALQKLGIISKVALLFPFYCLFYMVAPGTRSGKLMRKPFMKFLIHASSYLFFLLLLILVSQRAEDQIIDLFGTEAMRKRLPEYSGRFRGNPPSILEYVVLLYVIGFIYEETVEMYVTGFRSYLKNLWNFIDFTRNFLYTAVFVLRFAAYIHQTSEIAADPSTAFIRREDWQAFDPQLIAEGLFAGANIFSALKLVHLFSINPHLGPLQISLGRMVIDIVKFFFIYSLVLFAFACGLNQLLWYFSDLERKKCYHLPNGEPDLENEGEACVKWRRFANVFESSQSLFWASFGMINISDFELTGIKTYTRFWGLLMFGSYSVINVIVLLNLLIAMMSNSYAMIDEHSDIEWKFARTKLWMSYFEEACTLPSPFNLFPQFKLFLKIFGLRKKDKLRRMSTKRKSRVEKERDYKYTAVMRALVWRYISSMHKKIEENTVTEDDVSELKGDISSFRYEILDVLQKNGMDISSAEKKDKAVLGKRMKIWERRLMKDFKVGPVSADEDQNLIFQDPPSDEDSLSRFRRVAKLAVLDSSLNKWRQVVKGACIASQIGKCHTRDSFRKQQNLQKAIQEAKKLSEESPGYSRAVTPIELPDTIGTSIIKVMEDYVIEEQTGKATGTLSKFQINRSPHTDDRNVEANVKISLRPPPSKRGQKNKSQAPLPGSSHDHRETSDLINLESQKSSPVGRNSSNSLSSACEEIEQILRKSGEGSHVSPPSIILSPPKLETGEISMKRDVTEELSQKCDNETVLSACEENFESKPDPEYKISESVNSSDIDMSNVVQLDAKGNLKEGEIKTPDTHTVNGIKDISKQEIFELDKKSNSQDLDITSNEMQSREHLGDKKLMEEKAPEVKNLTANLNVVCTVSNQENVDSEGIDKKISNLPNSLAKIGTNEELVTKQNNTEGIINDQKEDTVETETKGREKEQEKAPAIPDNDQTAKEGEASDNSKLTVENQPTVMVKSPLSERNIYRVRAKSPNRQPKYGWL